MSELDIFTAKIDNIIDAPDPSEAMKKSFIGKLNEVVDKKSVDHVNDVRGRIYKAFYRITRKGFEPEFIYLGHDWLRAIDDIMRAETGYYGERISTFCDIPIVEVIGYAKYFHVSIKEPSENIMEKKAKV